MTDLADADAARSSSLDRLGPRATQRAEPRASIALAGAGCALAVIGVLVLSADAGDRGDGSFDRLPGTVLSLLVVGAGLVVLHLQRRGAIATAGAVALAAGIPAAIGFLVAGGSDGRIDTVVALAAVAWLAAYLVGPGRGRPVFLGLALYGLWSTSLQIVGSGGFLPLMALAPVSLLSFGEACSSDAFGASECTPMGPFGAMGGPGGFDQPDWAAIGIVSLAVGAAYLFVSRRLDRRGRHGMSTPFVLVGLLAILQGIASFGIELRDAQGLGAVVLAASLGIAVFGGSTGRRFTTWFGAGGAVAGIALLLLPDVDSAGVAGFLLLGAGLLVVAVTHLVADHLGEPDELEAPRRWPAGSDGHAEAGSPADPGDGRLVADAPIAVLEPEPEWADGPMLELEPLPAVGRRPSRAATAPRPADPPAVGRRPSRAATAPRPADPPAPGAAASKPAATKAVARKKPAAEKPAATKAVAEHAAAEKPAATKAGAKKAAKRVAPAKPPAERRPPTA